MIITFKVALLTDPIRFGWLITNDIIGSKPGQCNLHWVSLQFSVRNLRKGEEPSYCYDNHHMQESVTLECGGSRNPG